MFSVQVALLLCVLSIACNESTEPSAIQMDASFRFADVEPLLDDGPSSSLDVGLPVDGEISGIDMHLLPDGLVMDTESPAEDAGLVDDVGLTPDAVVDVMPDQGAPEPGPDCDELNFVDLNAEAEREGEEWIYRGEVRQDRFRGSCSTAGTRGADAVMRFQAPSTGEWRFDTVGSEVDTDVYLRSVCRDAESERACNSDVNLPAGMTHSRVVTRLEEGEYVFVVVDSYNGLSRNPFQLTIMPHEPLPQPTVETLRGILLTETDELAIRDRHTLGAAPSMLHFVAIGPEDQVRGRRRYQPVENILLDDGSFAFVSVVEWSAQDRMMMSRLRLQLVDGDGEESEWLNTVPRAAEPAEDFDGLCHPESLPCSHAEVCVAHQYRPREEVQACPDHWRSTVLAPDPFGRSIFLGTILKRMDSWSASCGGGNNSRYIDIPRVPMDASW